MKITESASEKFIEARNKEYERLNTLLSSLHFKQINDSSWDSYNYWDETMYGVETYLHQYTEMVVRFIRRGKVVGVAFTGKHGSSSGDMDVDTFIETLREIVINDRNEKIKILQSF